MMVHHATINYFWLIIIVRGDLLFSQCSSMSRQLAYGHSLWGKVDSGFEHLQSIISCGSSSKFTSNSSVQTKTNVRYEAMKHLLLTALRLLSATNVLEEYIKVICSNQSSRTLIAKKSQHLKKFVLSGHLQKLMLPALCSTLYKKFNCWCLVSGV